MNVALLEQAFAENFTKRGELGASCAVWQDGRELLSLSAGFQDRQKTEPWTDETTVLVWSATKGIAAGCLLHALGEAGLHLETRVADCWPEFASGGKEKITIGEVMSHQGGLAALREDVSTFEYTAVIRSIERQAPLWPPGEGHGYHPRTFGFLVDELVRRVSGLALGDYWRRHFGEPLALDFWMGLPDQHAGRVSPIHGSRVAPSDDAFLQAFADPASLTNRAFASPVGLHTPSAMNTPEARRASFPGIGGIGTADALAEFYALCANGGVLQDQRFFSTEALRWMETTLTSGPDRVLQIPTAFSAGFMKDPLQADGTKLRQIFGPSPRAFGQPGAGGSVGFADPENNIAFAYVMNQMEPGVLPNARAMALIGALYS